jgi:putative hydrolase of the HAD superfamily
MAIKFIYFDVANTLLHKPDLFPRIMATLEAEGLKVEMATLKYHHKLLSETIKFPDKTDSQFYEYFNGELLYSLGIIPNAELLARLFAACTYLPWQPFADTAVLSQLPVPVGIISNFDKSLRERLASHFATSFAPIIISAEQGYAKPDPRIFADAISTSGFLPQEILFVGDSIKLDMAPAIASGLQVALIDRDQVFASFSGPRLTEMGQLLALLPTL